MVQSQIIFTFVMYLRIECQYTRMQLLSSMLLDARLDVSLTALNSMLHAKIFKYSIGENCCHGTQMDLQS